MLWKQEGNNTLVGGELKVIITEERIAGFILNEYEQSYDRLYSFVKIKGKWSVILSTSLPSDIDKAFLYVELLNKCVTLVKRDMISLGFEHNLLF